MSEPNTTATTPAEQVFVVEPSAASSGLIHHPVLHRPLLAGVALAPMPAAYLAAQRAVISRKVMLLTEAEAAARLVDEIVTRSVGDDERTQRFARQLKAAAALDRLTAPLLHRPDVRAALDEALVAGDALLEAVAAAATAARRVPIAPPAQR